MINNTAIDSALFVKMALSAWQGYNDRFLKLLESVTAEQLALQVAPNRNTGVYLIGHLVSVSDGMRPLLGIGDRLYPQLVSTFETNPDNPDTPKPSVEELRKYLHDINQSMSEAFGSMEPEAWFERHNAVSAEDFAKEPHRNKLNIIINRTNHLSYHLGQLIFLKR
jgi:hypothetical protein